MNDFSIGNVLIIYNPSKNNIYCMDSFEMITIKTCPGCGSYCIHKRIRLGGYRCAICREVFVKPEFKRVLPEPRKKLSVPLHLRGKREIKEQ